MRVDLELVLKNLKDVQNKVKSTFKDIPAGISGGITGAGGGGGAGSFLGKATIAMGAVLVISEGVKRIITFMGQASPILKGTLDIFKRAFLIYFRPFGDALASFLKPMAFWMIKMAVKFLQFSRTPGGGLVAEAGAGAAVGAALGVVVGGIPGAALGAALGAAIPLLDDAFQGVKNIGIIVTAWADEAVQTFLGINMDEVRAKVATFMLVTWPSYVNTVREKVAVFMLETWPAFVDTMKTKTIEGWQTVKTFFSETVVGWVKSAFGGIKTFFTETIPGWITAMINNIKEIFGFGNPDVLASFGGGSSGGRGFTGSFDDELTIDITRTGKG